MQHLKSESVNNLQTSSEDFILKKLQRTQSWDFFWHDTRLWFKQLCLNETLIIWCTLSWSVFIFLLHALKTIKKHNLIDKTLRVIVISALMFKNENNKRLCSAGFNMHCCVFNPGATRLSGSVVKLLCEEKPRCSSIDGADRKIKSLLSTQGTLPQTQGRFFP